MMTDVSDDELASFLGVALEICSEAAEMVRHARRTRNIAVSTKDGFELVTNLDHDIDRLFRAKITRAFPSHHILSEEGEAASMEGSGVCWIIDPLDGTANFANGLPHVAISAAVSVDSVVRLGAVDAPFYGETFHAVKGQGAFRDGQRIKASAITEPHKALIATGFPHDRHGVDELIDGLKPLLRDFGDIRRLAAPALDVCWVADGRLAGFLDRLFVWDFAAAGLIAKEAGALTHTSEIGESSLQQDYLVAAPGIYAQLLAAKLNDR
jgi:myo-inositol-1(or 4)-monophosphatase